MHRFRSPTLPLVMLLLLVVVVVVLLAGTASRGVDAVTMVVRPTEKTCLMDVVPMKSSMAFQFHMFSGEEVGLTVSLLDENQTTIKAWENAVDGIYESATQNHVLRSFTVCFDNTRTYYNSKMISFFFRYHIDYTAVAKLSELDPIELKVHSMATTVRDVEALQVRLRSEQKEHMKTVEDTMERHLMWSAFQVVALVAMSLIQIYFLKRFLERKSFV